MKSLVVLHKLFSMFCQHISKEIAMALGLSDYTNESQWFYKLLVNAKLLRKNRQATGYLIQCKTYDNSKKLEEL